MTGAATLCHVSGRWWQHCVACQERHKRGKGGDMLKGSSSIVSRPGVRQGMSGKVRTPRAMHEGCKA